MESSEEVKEMFSASKGANQWDEMYKGRPATFEQHIFTARRNFAVQFVEKHCDKKSDVLDLGCGAGPFVSEMLRLGYSCLATDYSADILANAVKRIESVGDVKPALAQSDCQFIPFASGAFDAVVCLGVISYVPNRLNALREMYRITKPGGRLLLTFRNYYNPVVYEPTHWLKGVLGKPIASIHAEREGEFKPGAFLKTQEIKPMLEQVGFKVDATYGIGRGPWKLLGRKVLPEAASIVFDKCLQKVFAFLGLSRWLAGADVVIITCERPA